ncbi:MAG: ATP-binding protein [Actinomycetota bacterium]|jgi:hypothetical protein|nr:ATP-binding protein [Actinomycetota bacterium]
MSDSDRLLDFVSSVSGEEFLKVEENFGDGFVRLRISEAERRQAQHDIRGFEDIVVELLRNARDARAHRIFVASSRDGDIRTLTIIDDGVGIPCALHDRVFEPRVTSKLETMVVDKWGVHGRGMALYSVRTNVVSARIASSAEHKGTALTIVSDTTDLAERSDQSTWPAVERDENGELTVCRGPHNIIRRVLEFAVEHPQIHVYMGTPAEVLSTLHGCARDELGTSDILFCDDTSTLPVWQRAAVSADAAELVAIADQMGLSISERTAHRIMASELCALETVLAQASPSEEDVSPSAPDPDIYKDRRGLRIHHADLDMFRRELERAFDTIGERYYVHLKGEPKITVKKDGLQVKFDIEKED